MKKGQRKNFLLEQLNRLSLSKKLLIMQIFCIILPLFITDGIIIGIMVQADRQAGIQEMNNVADSVKYTLSDSVESAVVMMQNIYRNRFVNEFIEEKFENPLDYYSKHVEFIRDSLYTVSMNSDMYHLVIYGDNPGIVDGGYFQRVQNAEQEEWYLQLQQSKEETLAFTDFEKVNWQRQRSIYLVRRMDYYHMGAGKSVMKLELNYSRLLRGIINTKYSCLLYVCDDNRILFSNDGRGGPYVDFDLMGTEERHRAGVHTMMNVYGRNWDIYVMPPKMNYLDTVVRNWPILLFMVALNLLLPFALMNLINLSFTRRLKELEQVFANGGKNELYPVSEVSGRDEISELMESYNNMAERINELIETEYKNRLKRQEMNIARQKAELLALHSQINPHFLFNALESIRMHSVIKREYETADMVEKLALMQRQNVEWGNDSVKIRDEIRFIEAYLELQKYRFGDRLRYEIHVAQDCEDYRLPKLTLVTFVENACVHGIENKATPGWVFVRISRDEEALILEVEDTGNGMSEQKCRKFLQEMNQVKIEKLQENRRIGILNAALRLKMYSEEQVRFELESERGVGTLVTIVIPLAAAEQMKLR
ncbi:MAG: sensor histidine kinase [Roseburia sp.]|nr:sensor histidine kinase [Roseburia sp.]